MPRNLEEDIEAFVQWMSPTSEEIAQRTKLSERVFATITECCGKECKPLVFGSTATGLFSPLSDIDIVVLGLEGDLTSWIYRLAEILQRDKNVVQLRIIASARVPLIKFIDAKTCIPVDICLNVDTGPRNTATVKQLLKEYPMARKLFVVLKYLLSVCGLNEVYTGGLGSYALFLMVIASLQQQSMSNTGSVTLSSAMLHFFSFFGSDFSYNDKGISVREEGSFFDKEERGWSNIRCPHALSIEDPGNPENDVTRSSFHILYIRELFQNCSLVLQEGSLLESLFPYVLIPSFKTRKPFLKEEIPTASYSANHASRKYSVHNHSRANCDSNWRVSQKENHNTSPPPDNVVPKTNSKHRRHHYGHHRRTSRMA